MKKIEFINFLFILQYIYYFMSIEKISFIFPQSPIWLILLLILSLYMILNYIFLLLFQKILNEKSKYGLITLKIIGLLILVVQPLQNPY